MKMKHFAALLLVLLLALGTSAQVLADEPDAEGELRDEPPKEGVFQEGSFSGPQTIPGEPMAVAESWEEDLKAMILEGWTARKKEVDISSLRIPKSELNRYWDVLHTLQNDHPELFYIGIDSVWNNGTIFVRSKAVLIRPSPISTRRQTRRCPRSGGLPTLWRRLWSSTTGWS